jgi:predicted nucleotidyltransferase
VEDRGVEEGIQVNRYFKILEGVEKGLEENLEKYIEALRGLATRYSERLYIFGSYLKCYYTTASGVDLLIEVPDSVDRPQVLHEARRLVQKMGESKYTF